MTKLFSSSVLVLGLSMVAAVPSSAAEPDRIAAMLEQQKIKYEVDKDKDYKIVFDFESEKRSQVVFISGETEEFDGMKIRTVFAPAAKIDKDPIDGQLMSLLKDYKKIGAWRVNGDVLYFSAGLVEPFTAEELSALLRLVSSVADDKEIEISGKRDEL